MADTKVRHRLRRGASWRQAPEGEGASGSRHYNGQGTSNSARYDLAALFAGRVLNVARRYGALAASYDITPLVKLAGYGILNIDDRSGLVWPRLEYSITSNLDLASGIQRFFGGVGSEYGRIRNIFHAAARWFFRIDPR